MISHAPINAYKTLIIVNTMKLCANFTSELTVIKTRRNEIEQDFALSLKFVTLTQSVLIALAKLKKKNAEYIIINDIMSGCCYLFDKV